jgi:hypothetical protein
MPFIPVVLPRRIEGPVEPIREAAE